MEKFLYLKEHAFVHAWVNGGSVPLSLASSYLDETRAGTKTPDETYLLESTAPPGVLREYFRVRPGQRHTFENTTVNGEYFRNNVINKMYQEDCLVLCLSNRKSASIAKGLTKIACVKILDVEALKAHLDSQLGTAGTMGDCSYTSEHNRDHFLKSVDDEWMQEFRITWPITSSQTVHIPRGTARVVKLGNIEVAPDPRCKI